MEQAQKSTLLRQSGEGGSERVSTGKDALGTKLVSLIPHFITSSQTGYSDDAIHVLKEDDPGRTKDGFDG